MSFHFYAIVIILAFTYLELYIELHAGIIRYTTALNNPVHGVGIHLGTADWTRGRCHALASFKI